MKKSCNKNDNPQNACGVFFVGGIITPITKSATFCFLASAVEYFVVRIIIFAQETSVYVFAQKLAGIRLRGKSSFVVAGVLFVDIILVGVLLR